MLFMGGKIIVYTENHTKHKYTCARNAGYYNVKAGGTYSNHRVLKG
jgi:hypothetical protein